MTDSISAAEERALRAQLTALERKQDARFARRETLLRERDRALAGQASELEATIKDYREQLAAAQAELAALDEPPERPPLPQEQQLGLEEKAARIRAMALGSPEHMRLRQQFGISKPFIL